MSVAAYDKERVLVGLDASPSQDRGDIHNMILSQVSRIRRDPVLGKCMIVVFVESNSSKIDANQLRDLLLHDNRQWRSKIHVASSETKIQPPAKLPAAGVWTNQQNKKRMVQIAADLLANDKLRVSDSLNGSNVQTDLADIEEQLRRFTPVVEVAKNLFGKTKVTYSGKRGGKKDDLAMALLIALYWERYFLNEPGFVGLLRANGVGI